MDGRKVRRRARGGVHAAIPAAYVRPDATTSLLTERPTPRYRSFLIGSVVQQAKNSMMERVS